MTVEDQSPPDPLSKTRRKQEMHALQRVGAKLTEFSDRQLDQLPLSDKLRSALREFGRLPNSHGARRRQLQYIGRLMRDFDLEEIEHKIDLVVNPPPTRGDDQSRIDEQCTSLLQEGDIAINQLLKLHPELDRQTLRRYHLAYLKADSDGQHLDKIHRKLKKYLLKELN